ncbi:MAG: ABC transporter permease [Euryarchaeota archaeon]|nr:ABC transporter permease [Euryarchaeota archaeon]
MPRLKWWLIARNEYLLKTSGIRRWRRLFPIATVVLLAWYVMFAAPAVFSLASDLTKDLLLSEAALSFMQVMLFIIFISVFTVPIIQTLQDTNLAPLETLLSAPVRPADVLLGKFLGMLPTYSILITVLAGTFLALFIPFGMTMDQVLLSMIVFVLVVLIALWLGLLSAAMLKARLNRSRKGREAGQALALIIALPLVGLMYLSMNGEMMDALQGQGASLSDAFWLLPSSWGADLVLRFLRHPGDLGFDLGTTLLGLAGLAGTLVLSLVAGVRLSGRAYDLDPVSFATPRAAPEGRLYAYARALAGNKHLGTVLVTVMKDYGRRLENLSRIVYILGLVVMMEVFMLGSLPPGNYVTLALLTASWLMAFLCVFVVGEVTARGKDNLFIYRKAPGGEKRLVLARVMQGLLVVQPVAAISALVVLLPAGLPLFDVLMLTGWMIVVSSFYVVMSTGLFLLFPAFSERPLEVLGNAVLMMTISFLLFIFSFAFFGEHGGLYALMVSSAVLGTSFLLMGWRKLTSLE